MNKTSFHFLHAAKAARFAETARMHPASLKRQLRSARHILDRLYVESNNLKGMLLADDVGLGKTTIGAIVAWAAAGEGEGRVVRILAPNMVMRQRWEDELKRVLPAMEAIARGDLKIGNDKLRHSDQKLHRTHIHVTTQARAASGRQLKGELIIVDEAHRSKSDSSRFRQAISHAIGKGAKVLLLTATPMSIKTEELGSLIGMLAGDDARKAVCAYGKQIRLLYEASDDRTESVAHDELVAAADAATRSMGECVIRYSIDALAEEEQRAFGPKRKEWKICVPPASHDEIGLLARVDRLNRLVSQHGSRANDPRFHVARSPIQHAIAKPGLELGSRQANLHRDAIVALGLLQSDHPKMDAVSRAVAERCSEGEKVIVFCHHHLVAAEMTRVLARHVVPHANPDTPEAQCRAAWMELLEHAPGPTVTPALLRAFIEWICTPSFRDQVSGWLKPGVPFSADALRLARPDRCNGSSIAESMLELMREVFKPGSASTIGVFRQRTVGTPSLKALPFGSTVATRVIGACGTGESIANHRDGHLFLQEERPDLLLALFNSPFGPDALVLTDKYSEGIDLHRHCRFLVHYELNPSPMRTIQREGRVRRIGNWASMIGLPVEYAMPSFGNTRDERAVNIMRGRLENFGRLLGGIPSYEGEGDESGADVDARAQRIMQRAAATLDGFARRLRLK